FPHSLSVSPHSSVATNVVIVSSRHSDGKTHNVADPSVGPNTCVSTLMLLHILPLQQPNRIAAIIMDKTNMNLFLVMLFLLYNGAGKWELTSLFIYAALI